MNNSLIARTEKSYDIKSKKQLKRVVLQLLPQWRNIRILTDATDLRSQGNAVAICEADTNGKLTFLKGAPNLSLAADFFKAAVDDGRLQ